MRKKDVGYKKVLSVCGEDAVNECSYRKVREEESLVDVLETKEGSIVVIGDY